MTEISAKNIVSRRSFIISASAFGLASLSIPNVNAGQELMKPVVWKGAALGAEGTIKLYHSNEEKALAALRACQKEIARLEALFSLYQPGSQILQLNKTGQLNYPDIDFLNLLSTALAFSEETGGLFDISVQPLWQFYADFYTQEGAAGVRPSQSKIDQVLEHVGYDNIEVTSEKIQLKKPGMAITLNGIAQGYITDRVTSLLQEAGFENVLISLGEIYALGPKIDGSAWQVGLEGDLDNQNPQRIIPLINRALATSGGYASPFSNKSTANHLLNPLTGDWSRIKGSISALSESATHADMTSTALALMTTTQRKLFLMNCKDIDAVFYSSPEEGDWHKSI